MLSVLSLTSPAQTVGRDERAGFDPGIFTFVSTLIESLRRNLTNPLDDSAAALIAANGGQLTDSVEREIAYAHVVGRY